MPTPPVAVLSLYAAAVASFVGAVNLRHELPGREHSPLVRGLGRGELRPGVPRLDPDDAMANAALLRMVLSDVGTPGFDEGRCSAAPRTFAVLLDGRLSRVRVGARQVCQLQRLKEVSVAQPGFGQGGLGEVAAYLLGRRLGETPDVDITRIIVPPFRFSRDRVVLSDADLGALLPGEKLVGTWHTHPDDDLAEGLLSPTDLRFMRYGKADFHGEVGAFRRGTRIDWIFDIVEPRDGDWNVFAHDKRRLDELLDKCAVSDRDCPLEELRLVGSPFYLLTRYYEEKNAVSAR